VLRRGAGCAPARRAAARLAAAPLAAALLLFCCSSKSDDERWRERIESSPVYLYAALKILVAEPERDADVKAARELLDELERAPAAEQDLLATSQRVFALGQALWKLRSLGEAEVAKGRESTLRVLFKEPDAAVPELRAETINATEHGILLLFTLLAQLDGRAPVPVPEEAPLYEAYLVGEEPLAEPELAALVLSAQAATTARAELCDVAGRFSDRLAARAFKSDPNAAESLLKGVLLAAILASNPHTSHEASGATASALARALPWVFRLLAHARTAACFDGRDQAQRARVEWERAAALAVDAGVPKPEVAIIQAYAAYRAEDWEATQRHLRVASDSAFLSASEREQALQLAERIDPQQRGAVDGFFNKVFIARFVASLVHRRLLEAGVYDSVLALPRIQQARAALNAVTLASETSGEGLWKRMRSWLATD
jgi:hypothetical protein